MTLALYKRDAMLIEKLKHLYYLIKMVSKSHHFTITLVSINSRGIKTTAVSCNLIPAFINKIHREFKQVLERDWND